MNQEDYKNHIERLLQGLGERRTRKFYQVAVCALQDEQRLSGQNTFKIPLQKFTDVGITNIGNRKAILTNLHNATIIYVSNKTTQETIIDNPEIVNDPTTAITTFHPAFDYLAQRLTEIVRKYEATKKITAEKPKDEIPQWTERFHWIDAKQFYLDEGKIIIFNSTTSDRIKVFKILTEAKGNWVKISEIAKTVYKQNNHKLHHKIRVIIQQLNEEKFSKYNFIKLTPLNDTDAGAYRIELLS